MKDALEVCKVRRVIYHLKFYIKVFFFVQRICLLSKVMFYCLSTYVKEK